MLKTKFLTLDMLNIDIYFHKALSSSTKISEIFEGRIYNTGRSTFEEDEDRIPYLIVTYEGGETQDINSKELVVEDLDTARVSVLCVAEEREELASYIEEVEDTIAQSMNSKSFDEDEFNFGIDSATHSASPVQYDPEKPCYYQILTYICKTYRK